MKESSVSVIIPVYNTEKYLDQAIQSVLGQTVQPDEIIIVDDGSTDNSLEVSRQFLPRIKILTQKNKGAAAARNNGINHASGHYIAFLDADDLWIENKLEQQLKYLAGHPETAMVFGTVRQFISPELPDDQKIKLNPELEKLPGFVPGILLMQKGTFLKVGLFDEKLELGEFIDWFSRAKDMGLQYHLPEEVFLKRRIHTTNMGIYKKQHLKDYTSILRAALARKRKADGQNQ